MADMEGRFTRHTRRVAYENPRITVWHDEITRPDGSPGIYGVVHFENLAAGVVAFDDEDASRWSASTGLHPRPRSVGHPEGGVSPAETPLAASSASCARRPVEATDWRELCRLDLSNSVTDEEAILFVARAQPRSASPEPTDRPPCAGSCSTWRSRWSATGGSRT